jgi:hypothetical protein
LIADQDMSQWSGSSEGSFQKTKSLQGKQA